MCKSCLWHHKSSSVQESDVNYLPKHRDRAAVVQSARNAPLDRGLFAAQEGHTTGNQDSLNLVQGTTAAVDALHLSHLLGVDWVVPTHVAFDTSAILADLRNGRRRSARHWDILSAVNGQPGPTAESLRQGQRSHRDE